MSVEREDVCPVAVLPQGATIDDYLGTLGKKTRHEIRRKVRRAEAAGDVSLDDSPDPLADLEAFIDLHQRRWGVDGLFPDTPGGAQSRVFFRRLFELFGASGPMRLSFLTVGGTRIAAGISFEVEDAILYYNAGVDPEARELSPGVVMVERYVRRALERGLARMDFLRGDEPYKYEWGARDEPIQRLLIRRTDTPMTPPLPWDRCLAPMVHAPVPGPGSRAGRPGPRDRHQRRRPGARVQPGLAPGPRVLRRLDRVALERQRGPQAPEGRLRRHGHRLDRRRDRDGDRSPRTSRTSAPT